MARAAVTKSLSLLLLQFDLMPFVCFNSMTPLHSSLTCLKPAHRAQNLMILQVEQGGWVSVVDCVACGRSSARHSIASFLILKSKFNFLLKVRNQFCAICWTYENRRSKIEKIWKLPSNVTNSNKSLNIKFKNRRIWLRNLTHTSYCDDIMNRSSMLFNAKLNVFNSLFKLLAVVSLLSVNYSKLWNQLIENMSWAAMMR